MKGFFFFLIFLVFLGGMAIAAESTVIIDGALDYTTLRAHSAGAPEVGRILAIHSETSPSGIIGFASITSVRLMSRGGFEIRAHLLRLSRYDLVLPGDHLEAVDLRSQDANYQGHAELLIRNKWESVSAKYRPLYLQSFLIGETAETLGGGEFFVGMYGNAAYGLTQRLTFSSILPGYFFASPNGTLKLRAYQNDNDTVSIGTSVTKVRDSNSTSLNINLFWDSVTSDHMISHTLLSLAAYTIQKEQDTYGVKGIGTSSLQTGYEVILRNWDRVLFGPIYNFDTKTVGGYLAYTRIWDHFHLSAFLQSVDLRNVDYNPKTGYVASAEFYWRF